MEDDYAAIRLSYSHFLTHGSPSPAPDPHMEHLSRFKDPPTDDHRLLDDWNWQKKRFLGHDPLDFEYGQRLDEVKVIAQLVIRRRYFRNISANALSMLFQACTCIETVHLERWCWGRRKLDREWDRDSSTLLLRLSPSLKRFSLYDEFNTTFHRQQRGMILPRSNTRLLKSLTDSVLITRLEHLCVSFSFDARNFFSTDLPHEWTSLKTVALTSDVLTSRSSAMAGELLLDAARVAKAGIFGYDKSEKAIVWQGTWHAEISIECRWEWHRVCFEWGHRLDELGVAAVELDRESCVSLSSIRPYLKLRKHILHDVSWTHV
ncbi:hypothetical protein F66182_9688 [Fusarium sp. NRRL 66182]|nr:hypothetical protein F66182_9688 [Fusarium sp. NRRL 66182]